MIIYQTGGEETGPGPGPGPDSSRPLLLLTFSRLLYNLILCIIGIRALGQLSRPSNRRVSDQNRRSSASPWCCKPLICVLPENETHHRYLGAKKHLLYVGLLRVLVLINKMIHSEFPFVQSIKEKDMSSFFTCTFICIRLRCNMRTVSWSNM